jgi:FlgD Ig-like domain
MSASSRFSLRFAYRRSRRGAPFVIMATVAAVVVAAAPARASVATALLREDGQLPGAPAGHMVEFLNNTAVNHAGGYAVSVNSTDGVADLSHIWGNAAGGPGSIIRTEGTFGSLVQTSYESFYGMADAGEVAYSAIGTGGPVGGFDSVWRDDTPVAVEGDPVPTLAGQYWSFASRPGITGDASPYWSGGITTTPGGATQNRGLFFGMGATVVLLGGVAVPDLPFPPVTSSIDFDYRYSALGGHFIIAVTMSSGSTTNDGAVVLDGSGLMIDGTLAREGSPVPAAAGGLPGENWGLFDLMGVSEAGDWFFTANTSAATTADEIVVKNGAVLFREGNVLDGRTLTGDIEGAYMNEDGDIALVWDVQDTTVLEALYVNDRLALVEGDIVDLDGDGAAEAGSKLADFTGISTLTMSDRDAFGVVRVYFTADVDTANTASTTDDIEGFFCLAAPTLGSTSVASAGGPAAQLLSIAPNPSAGLARVHYSLSREARVALVIFDVSGRLVTRLDGGVHAAGTHEAEWDGRDASGRTVAPGTYFLRLDGGAETAERKIIRVR